MAIDRRVARTRATLHRALFSLILEKGYEAITITDICEAANVGRTTFYAHYPSKDGLKRSGLDHLRQALVERHREAAATAPDNGRPSLAFSLTMFEHAAGHIELYRALAGGRGGALALATIREILCELVRSEYRPGTGAERDQAPRELIVQFIVGAYMAVLTWWLDGGAKARPERMDAMFRKLSTEGIGAAS